jgi:hypothetical protein
VLLLSSGPFIFLVSYFYNLLHFSPRKDGGGSCRVAMFACVMAMQVRSLLAWRPAHAFLAPIDGGHAERTWPIGRNETGCLVQEVGSRLGSSTALYRSMFLKHLRHSTEQSRHCCKPRSARSCITQHDQKDVPPLYSLLHSFLEGCQPEDGDGFVKDVPHPSKTAGP